MAREDKTWQANCGSQSINGRVLLIELPTNSVFMRLRRRVHCGLGKQLEVEMELNLPLPLPVLVLLVMMVNWAASLLRNRKNPCKLRCSTPDARKMFLICNGGDDFDFAVPF
ncbi:hypothetical protein ACLKA7_006489 [Drosophila subpalustris]